MKIIRAIKLARVPYGELDEGDEYHFDGGGWPDVAHDGRVQANQSVYEMSPDDIVEAYDTKKYIPRSETYTIEGVGPYDFYHIGHNNEDDPLLIAGPWEFRESEITTVYI